MSAIDALWKWLLQRETENYLLRAALEEAQAIKEESEERKKRNVELLRQVDALTLAEAKRKARTPKAKADASR